MRPGRAVPRAWPARGWPARTAAAAVPGARSAAPG